MEEASEGGDGPDLRVQRDLVPGDVEGRRGDSAWELPGTRAGAWWTETIPGSQKLLRQKRWGGGTWVVLNKEGGRGVAEP